MTVILGALDGEISEVRDSLSNARLEHWHGFPIHTGSLAGRSVVVARTGVGKSLSAMLCQHLIDTYAPRRILFTGVAGALDPDLDIGDTIVARDCMIHDMDATALGFARGEVPYTPFRILECDPDLVRCAEGIAPLSGRMVIGRVLTGDQFVASARTRGELRALLEGDAVEMEGASVGLVARVNEIPFLLIRTISDKANGRAHVDFGSFLTYASRNSRHYLEQIIAAC